MKNKIATCIFFIYFIIASAFAGNDVFFHKISISQGLSQFSVMSIYQDEFGVLWFGTREGVNRYNGNIMEVIYPTFSTKNALPESIIYNICGDKKGHVYFHSQNGVTEYNLYTSSINTITQNNVDAIAYGAQELWIAEGNLIYSYRDGHKTLFTKLETTQSPISYIMQASDMRIYVGTISSGVFVIDQNKRTKSVISGCNQVSCIFEDNNKTFWITTYGNGIYKIERGGSITNYHTKYNPLGNNICSNDVRKICQDNNGFMWIGTYNGLDKLNPEKELFTHYSAGENSSLYLSNESVRSLLKDNQGTIWVGTYFGGVDYFNPDINFYTFHDLQKGYFQNKPFPIISKIIEYENESIFLCTEGYGLIYYSLKDKTYKVFQANNNDTNSLIANNIKATYYDSQEKKLWIGTHLGGDGGVCVLDIQEWKFIRYPAIKPDWPKANNTNAIIPYNEDLLVATQNGLFMLDKKKKNFSLFSDKLHKIASFVNDIKIDKSNNLWIASINGVYKYNLTSNEIESYLYDASNLASISNNNATKILIDSKDRIWIATSGGGVNLYDETKNGFITYNKKSNGLINDFVSNICESFHGKIVISTTEGLAILDAENNKLNNFGKQNGFPLNSLYNGGMNVNNNGELFIAGMDGLISFYEEDLVVPHKKFKLNLANLWINNNIISPTDNTGILKKSMLYTNEIHLNSKQRMITIEFASDNYIQASLVSYRYKLEGFSDSWIELQQDIDKLNFMNLSPGKYNLVIEGSFREDPSVVDSVNLHITISPPIYNTWYAYLIYLLLISLIIWRYVEFSRSKVMLKASLNYEKKEKDHLEKVNQSKLRFFTNISHEFRTPLTLISGQVDMLLQMHDIHPMVYNRILNIKRSTFNMQNLINELLEFRKSEQGHLKIKVSQYDIVSFIYEIYLSFSEYANYKQVKFGFECQENNIDIWFDPIQLQKVFYNLISNAFKYTPQGGELKIIVEQDSGKVYVNVSDSGIGISSEDVEKIFDRFYQVENGIQINNATSGTGIGLALTKSILELHSADIKVSSQLEAGSCFTVILRKGLSHFSKEQIADAVHYDVDSTCVMQMNELDDTFFKEMVQYQHADKEIQFSMLIVEDNRELCAMLKNMFEPIYKVYTASDGEEGLALTIKHQPDIVLSDLMMPKMSGSEMCSKIKNNFSVCHIPVVLLTAQTAVESNIEGLCLGADDYITKPFDVKMLITRCNNLVNNRKILQDKFSRNMEFSVKQLATNNMDKTFLEKAHEIIEAHIDNPEFDVMMFSREMALGRTSLFRKIKGVTGQTPNEFIVTVRLQKAVEFFNLHSEFSVSEISHMVGFTSSKYFGKCFKAHFGISPSEFRKR